jgi:DNA-binding response OmpR family regulator
MTEARILLVEDDHTLRQVIAEALQDDGYAVDAIADGRSALQRAALVQPDLIILDLMMPHMNGEEFSVAVRQLAGLENVPIIIVSASRRAEEVGHLVRAEASLRKPFDLYELSDTVKQVLG